MRFLQILLFLLFTVSQGFSKYTFLGFSPDGQYCAYTWEEFNTRQDYILECRVLDVADNKYAGDKLSTKVNVRKIMKAAIDSAPDQFSMGPKLAHNNLDRKINALLKQFNIEKGNIGTRVFYLTLENRPVKMIDSLKIHKTDFKVKKESGQEKTYTLHLEERWADNQHQRSDDSKIFTLKLSRNGQFKTLQEDTYLSAYRNEPTAYSISSVYVYKGKLAVFLESITRLGDSPVPLIRVIPVTGDFKKEKE